MVLSRTISRQLRARRSAFTLIELLVVLAIIALLVAMLATYLRASREEAKALKCLTNLRTTGTATIMYFEDNEGMPLVPWYQVPPHRDYQPTVVTPWVFGGFRAPRPDLTDLGVDSSQYPAQIRPLN
jgi:prepilin-type N-terminal cleavage/methylation domain-containing protein